MSVFYCSFLPFPSSPIPLSLFFLHISLVLRKCCDHLPPLTELILYWSFFLSARFWLPLCSNFVTTSLLHSLLELSVFLVCSAFYLLLCSWSHPISFSSGSHSDLFSACHNLLSLYIPLFQPLSSMPSLFSNTFPIRENIFAEILPATLCCCLLSVAASTCCLLLSAHCTYLEVLELGCWARARGQGPGCAFPFMNWSVSCLLTWHFSVMSSMSSQRIADSLEVHSGRF